jgi:antitoxin MazE
MMQSQAKVSKWGNSLAIRLPQPMAAALSIEKGTQVELQMEENGFRVIVPSTPRSFTLAELLQGITPDNLHGEYDWGKPQGNEVW